MNENTRIMPLSYVKRTYIRTVKLRGVYQKALTAKGDMTKLCGDAKIV